MSKKTIGLEVSNSGYAQNEDKYLSCDHEKAKDRRAI